MSKIKKWQKVTVVIILILLISIAGLKIFKKQFLPLILNPDELIAYDVYVKSERALKKSELSFTAKEIVFQKYNENHSDDIFIIYTDNSETNCIASTMFLKWTNPKAFWDIDVIVYDNEHNGEFFKSYNGDEIYKSSDFYNFHKDDDSECRVLVRSANFDFNDEYKWIHEEGSKYKIENIDLQKIKICSLL